MRGGRSAGISDGNRDGNDGSHQRPETAVDTTYSQHIQPELGRLQVTPKAQPPGLASRLHLAHSQPFSRGSLHRSPPPHTSHPVMGMPSRSMTCTVSYQS